MSFIKTRDISFLLYDWLGVERLCDRPRFADHGRETFDAVLALSETVATEVFAPHYKAADRDEPRLENGKVVTLPEIGEALAVYRDSGFFSSSFPEELGGMQLPVVVSAASFAHFGAANTATVGYAMLTGANARLLVAHGTQAQIDTWARPQIEGRYFGTMCLSEPQAGSSLADIRTRAVPEGAEDALGTRYRLKGNKMWISGGDQEISENIVHLVLAKIPDAEGNLPAGVAGISLFAVPKLLPDGAVNDVSVAGLNHKMGYRGTVNTLLNFGESDGALGWRIGAPGQGLAIMFHMMNEARIMVGLGAAALAYRGYTQSLDYARTRPQGRAVQGQRKDPTSPQVPIIEHADVKRMLIAQKAFAEGGLALTLYSARLLDDSQTHPDADRRRDAHRLLDLLTPVTKSWPSEFGLIANEYAIQIHGGYGYTRDYDVEQIYRDNRLNPIHEGTHGIQGLDLVGRKILADQGEALSLLEAEINATLAKARDLEGFDPQIEALQAGWSAVRQTVAALMACPDKGRATQNASLFLTGFGHVLLAWIWLDKACTAHALGAGDADFRDGKLAACRYFFDYELPRALPLLDVVRSLNAGVADIPEAAF